MARTSNPAVTISFAAWGDFPWRRVPGYIMTQLAGAIAASAVIFVIFGGAIDEFESRTGIIRGQPGSEASAMVFGEFYPNPLGRPLKEANPARMSQVRAFLAEVIGTALLLLVIFCTTDSRNHNRPQVLTAATIGLTVTMLISLLGPADHGKLQPRARFRTTPFFQFRRMG